MLTVDIHEITSWIVNDEPTGEHLISVLVRCGYGYDQAVIINHRGTLALRACRCARLDGKRIYQPTIFRRLWDTVFNYLTTKKGFKTGKRYNFTMVNEELYIMNDEYTWYCPSSETLESLK